MDWLRWRRAPSWQGSTLAGLSDRAAEIPGWRPVIADVARQVAATQENGEWRFTVTDPDTGAVAWNGLTRRRPTAAQRRYVEARQPTCIFPGCRMPARQCDLDHHHLWSQGGATEVDNLPPECPARPPPQT